MSEAILSSRYLKDKAALKGAITRGVEANRDLGVILGKIKREETWREEFATWEKFCAACCDFKKRQADALIQDAEMRENLVLALHGMGTAEPILQTPLTSKTIREIAKEGPVEAQAEIVKAVIESQQPVNSGTVKREREKRAKAKVIDATTGQPEQQEFSFTIKASPEHREDAEWFSKLAEADRASIIAAARRAME